MNTPEILALGIGLAIDASCVCTTNGLVYQPNVKATLKIALPFGIAQGIMPLVGYFGIWLLPVDVFAYSHILALILLSSIGGKMLWEARQGGSCEGTTLAKSLTPQILFLQALSTSIDALGVGITLNQLDMTSMLLAAIIIAAITLVMCFGAVRIGKTIGTRLNSRAEVLGGVVLILLGIKMFLDGI